MKSSDNLTPHLSTDYDSQIRDTIPYYDCFHDETIRFILSTKLEPKYWLDTGCGTGSFVKKALAAFPLTSFTLADPSAEMLSMAKNKLSKRIGKNIRILDPAPTQSLPISDLEEFDIVSAIQSHHYLTVDGRLEATRKCFELLRNGGIYITFENVRPLTERGTVLGKGYWWQYQLSKGRDPKTVEKHLKRFGNEYFPITVEEHLSMLRRCGFSTVEIFWYSYVQAGFYCVK